MRAVSAGTCLLLLLAGTLAAQEEPPVRRAIPVLPLPEDAPVRRALPAQPMPVSTPASTPAPSATPTPEPTSTPLAPEAPTPAPTPEVPVRTPDQVLLEYANSLYARGLHDMAAPEFEKFLKLYPNSPDRQMATFRLGECHRATGNLNSAKTAYETLVASFGAGDFLGPAAYRLADLYYQEKNFQSALPFYRKASVLLKEPNIVTASRFYTGRCLEQLGRPLEARTVYEDVINAKANPDFVEASRLSLAQLLSAGSLKKEALKQYELLAKESAKPQMRAEALVKGGMLRLELKQIQQAKIDLEAALAIPEIGAIKEVAQIGVLKILFESESYKEFLAKYPPALEELSAEARPEILMLAATAHRQLSQNSLARDVYQRVSKEYPGTDYDNQARYELLLTLYNTNDPGVLEAAESYLASTSEGPKRDQVLLIKAETLFKKQDYAAALPVYQAVENSSLAPRLKEEALFRLGWCYQQSQQPEKAIAAFSKFLEQAPSHTLAPSALAQRAVAFQQTKDFAGALKDFDAILTRFPKAKERELALQQKALILGQQQDNSGMSGTFQKLLQEFPNSPVAAQANYWIGWAAFEAKEYKNAISPLENARKLDSSQFFERATLRIMLSHFYLEQDDALAAEVDLYSSGNAKGKVPAEILRWLGAEFFKSGQFELADKYLFALTARPDDLVAEDWLLLGRSQCQQGLFSKAIGSVETYLSLVNEPFPKATGLLILAQAQLGERKFEIAERSAEQACALQPEGKLNAQGRILLGDIAFTQADHEKAARIYMSVSVVFDDPQITPKALEKAALAYRKAGNESEASKVTNTLQSRYPEYSPSGKRD